MGCGTDRLLCRGGGIGRGGRFDRLLDVRIFLGMNEKFLAPERMGDAGTVGKVAGTSFFTAGMSEHFIAHSAFAPRAEDARASEVVGGFVQGAAPDSPLREI